MELNAAKRLSLANYLPREVGSLKESVIIKRIRDKVTLTDEEQETLDVDEETGSFDPQALDQIDSVEINLSDREREVLATALVKREQEDSVPTTDAFVYFVEELQDEIASVKQDIGDSDE